MTRRPSNVTALLEDIPAFSRQAKGGLFLVISGPDRGETIRLQDSSVRFGSATECELRLSDKTVSRVHLIAECDGNKTILRDNKSTNGTFFDGNRFSSVEIGFGDEVRLGRTVLKFLPDEQIVFPQPSEDMAFGQLVGGDTKMRQMFHLLADVAPTDATILIEGETGTGKELIAEEIHNHSDRKDGPFIVFDCGSVPSELIESALFGHLKGSFTGAVSDREGAFQAANGGTIFLDEIGEMALDLQPSLLRVLDKRAVRRVGSNTYEKIDVRVVAATNRDLRKEVAAKKFREDLYYRLAVIRVSVPPLRERGQDIEFLIKHFMRVFCPKGKKLHIDPADMKRLVRYNWPGNVRQLRNAMERASLLARGDSVRVDESLFETTVANDGQSVVVRKDLPFKEAKGQLVEKFEQEYLEDLLARHNMNLSAASREAQIDRKHLRELAKKYGIGN